MTRAYTTASVIQLAGIIGGVPAIQELYKASEQCLLMDAIMRNRVVPMIMKYRKHHFLTTYDQTTTTSRSYVIHPEAMDLGLYNVTLVNAAGEEYPLLPVDLDQEVAKRSRPYDSAAISGAPWGYYVRGDLLYLWPSVTAGLTLREHYYRRPNRFCRSAAYTYTDPSLNEAAEAVQVVSVNTLTGAITCTTSSVPSTITTSTPVDVIKGTPGFGIKIFALTPTAVTTSVVTLGGAAQIALVAAAGIEAGDWLCLAGDSPVIQLPVEVHGILAQELACKLLEGIEDMEGLAAASKERDELVKLYTMNYPLRVEQAPKETTSYAKLSDSVLDY